MRQAVLDGTTPDEVLLSDSSAFRYGAYLDRLASARDAQTWAGKIRDLEVHYIHGATGVGKTYRLIERHGSDLYRVTDYGRDPFGGYETHPVLVFDEFHGQLPITSMLEYLQGYPQALPSRYRNRQAAYTCVYVVSNLRIDKLYPQVQREKPEVWKAFRRRSATVKEQRAGGVFLGG